MHLAAFIQWIAQQLAADEKKFIEHLNHRQFWLRSQAQGQHARTPDNSASLLLGWEAFLNFARYTKVINDEEVQAHYDEGCNILAEWTSEQNEYVASEEPAYQYISLINAAISSGNAYLTSISNGVPPEQPELFGWQIRNDEGYIATPKGTCIGWVDGDDIYLQPTAAYAVAERMAFATGRSLSNRPKTLGKRLAEKRLLKSKDIGRNTKSLMVLGARQQVLHFSTKLFLEFDIDDYAKGKKVDSGTHFRHASPNDGNENVEAYETFFKLNEPKEGK